jgi:hypothetical protein
LTLAQDLQLDLPVSRATLNVYAAAKVHAPDDDEGRLIDVVGRIKPA